MIALLVAVVAAAFWLVFAAGVYVLAMTLSPLVVVEVGLVVVAAACFAFAAMVEAPASSRSSR